MSIASTLTEYLSLDPRVPIYDRSRVSAALSRYTRSLDKEYLDTHKWYDAWPNNRIVRRLKLLFIPFVLGTVWMYFNLNNTTTFFNFILFVLSVVAVGWFMVEFMRLSNSMSERWGPHGIRLKAIEPGSIAQLDSYADTIPDSVLQVAKTFLAAEPDGKVMVGEMRSFGKTLHPTSLRLRLGNQTASCWVHEAVLGKMSTD